MCLLLLTAATIITITITMVIGRSIHVLNSLIDGEGDGDPDRAGGELRVSVSEGDGEFVGVVAPPNA